METGGLGSKELAKVVRAVASIIKKHKEEVEGALSAFRRDSEKQSKQVNLSLSEAKAVRKVAEDLVARVAADIRSLREGIAAVERDMPPHTDLTALETDIEALQRAIADIPPAFNPTELAQSVERLRNEVEKVEEGLAQLRKRPGGRGGGGMNRAHITDIDLSSQLDGAQKTFDIPAVYNIITVALSSFPNVLRKGVDFTYTPTSITFTDEINAAASLAAGQTCILTVVNA